LEDLFEPAYRAGARIHNNSWGAATASTYTVDSNDLDAYAAKRRDVLIVIAAGNEGTATHPFNSAPCFVDWLSIGSPASSKNAHCMAYTDLPGRSLQNDLSVMVQDPTGAKITGNTELPAITNSDVDNNVEVIRVDDPAPGRWLIQVFARNLLRPPQDYA